MKFTTQAGDKQSCTVTNAANLGKTARAHTHILELFTATPVSNYSTAKSTSRVSNMIDYNSRKIGDHVCAHTA